ncbi:hypothetical protein [Bradyrhizobium sp. SEMIA]|uniref:hypothetical protein n=1 Tax=Bradyrhizobium sp. SEMIA TaxID=2597515 RepID=UPI0018A37AAD|nr:hypothetical protein [Bradyrhizobium sp. SEMIA]QOG20419.1 hypothetical protein FOM02_26785 [Bradyrhizobium sp. SEMIA]
MKPLSEHLTVLIATAEDMMRRPLHQMPTHLPAGFSEVAAAVKHADNSPCDGIRSTRAGVVMCTAIEAFFAEPDSQAYWQMLIGATLPLLRRAAWQALRNERAVSEEMRR